MPSTKRESLEMNCRGINLAVDLDNMPPGDFPYLLNTRSLQVGVLESRPGQIQINLTDFAAGAPTHSLFGLNNPVQPRIFAGAGGFLYWAAASGAGSGTYTLVDSGYSGNPLTGVTFRPDQSSNPYLYVGDSLKMRKFSGINLANVGITPPVFAPTPAIGLVEFNIISDFDGSPWANLGTAGTVTQSQRVSTTVAQVLRVRDTLLISPATTTNDWLAVGTRVGINNGTTGEVLAALEVMPAMGSTTVKDVIYWQIGAQTHCDVVLDFAIEGITRNSLLIIGSTLCAVESVIPGPNGQYALRIANTVGIGIGQTVTSICTFVVQTLNNWVVGNFITTEQMATLLTGAGVGSMVLNTTRDLSRILTRPTQGDDYIHISMYVDDASALVSARLKLDLGGGGFIKDYYQVDVRPSDLQESVAGPALAAGETAITNDLIQAGVPASQVSDVFSSGDLLSSQLGTVGTGGGWSEVVLHVSDLQRIGTDFTLSLKDVTALQVELTTTGNVNLAVSSWWLGGGYGPDVVTGSPTGIIYRYRYRSATTGAKSIPGPPTRYELFPKRSEISISVTTSADPQVTHIDIERLDPALQDTSGTPHWTYIGSALNTPGGPDVIFVDQLSPSEAAVNPPLEIDVVQPFPTLQPPINGTCNVAGAILTVLTIAPSAISAKLLPGTVVLINGIAYQTYGPGAGTLLANQTELTQSGGSLSNVQFSIASPVNYGTPLPILFGSMGGSTGLFTFGLGDPNNPGTLYWFNGNDMDSASPVNNLEITDPSEPLISGVVWENYVFVGTQKRLFLIEASFGSINPFTAKEIPAASGIIGPWAVSAGKDAIYYVGLDGVYKATPWYGGENISPDLWPLFPHQGKFADTGFPSYGGLWPVNLQAPTSLRIAVVNNDVYLDYVDIQGTPSSLIYTSIPSAKPIYGWTPDHYFNPVAFHTALALDPNTNVAGGKPVPFILMGTTNGQVMQAGGTADQTLSGVPFLITCKVWLPALNQGDTRAQKLYVDCITDLVGTATVELWGDYYETLISGPTTLFAASRSEQRTNIDLSGNLALYLNLGAKYTFNPGTKLYEFQPSYYPQPILSTNLVTQFQDLGMPGWKITRYGRFELICTGPVTLKILSSEGSTFTYTLVPGALLQSIDTQISALCKGRMFSYSLTSDLDKPFCLFGAFIKLKRWGDTKFTEVMPFSDALNDLSQIRKALTSG